MPRYIWIQGGTCALVEAAATSVMKTLATAPPAGTPQRPLLIPPSEPDDPAPGPCVDFLNGAGYQGCQPAQDRPMPRYRPKQDRNGRDVSRRYLPSMK